MTALIMAASAWDREHLWRFRARFHRGIDGDTFVALVDCGFGVAALPHIRIADLNAPELDTEQGVMARIHLGNALMTSQPVMAQDVPTWPLRIESRQRERVIEGVKSFDRYVATVWVVQQDGTAVDVRELLPGV